jgi:hypothetical protein
MAVRYGALVAIVQRNADAQDRWQEPLHMQPTSLVYDSAEEALYAAFGDVVYVHKIPERVVLEVRGSMYFVLDAHSGAVLAIERIGPATEAVDPMEAARAASHCGAPQWN